MCYIEQNRVRAKHAQLVAEMLYDGVSQDDDSAMVDMLKDIMHACKQVGLPFDQMLHCADKQFQCEVEDNTLVWCDETGPKFTAMDIARNIAVLESEGIVHTAMKSLLDAAWTQINDLCSETRAILLDEANGYKGSVASECPYWSGSSYAIETFRFQEDDEMTRKREKPEDILLKLRQVVVLQRQGLSMVEAVRQIGVTVQTYYRWSKEFDGMSHDKFKRLKQLEIENTELRRAVSDLTLDKIIWAGSVRGYHRNV